MAAIIVQRGVLGRLVSADYGEHGDHVRPDSYDYGYNLISDGRRCFRQETSFFNKIDRPRFF